MANNKYIRGISGRGFRVKNAAGDWKLVKEGAATNTQVDLEATSTQDILSRERDNFVRVADSTATTATVQALHRKGLRLRPGGGTFTVTIATPGVFSKTAHGFVLGDALVFSTTGALPTGLTAGTTYYVIAAGLTANAFRVSATSGGTVVDTSGSQSGTHTVTAVRRNVAQNQTVTVDLNDGDTKRLLKRNPGQWIVATGDTVNLVGLTDQRVSVDVKNAYATAVLTVGAANVTDADTVTINDVTYRFKNTLAQANDVKIGADSNATLDNLIAAVNQSGTPGTHYFAGTTAPTSVTSGSRVGTGAGATATFTSVLPGTGGDAFASTEASTNLSFGDTTFVNAASSGSSDVRPLKRDTSTVNVDLRSPYNVGQLRRRFKHWVEN